MTGADADVFVSYTQADRAWAEWIAWQLEDAGYRARVQAWDAASGMNFVEFMHEASAGSERTLAVLSPDYLQSKFAMKELFAAFAQGTLVVVRVRDVAVEGVLSAEVYTDLVGLDENAASERLLQEFKRDGHIRVKPDQAPRFPGHSAPAFPNRGVRFGIPHQAAFFTGRDDELTALGAAFAASGRAIVTQTIAGLGGVGKTQLAVRYVQEHLDEHDVVAWIRAEDGGVRDLTALAGVLGVAEQGLAPADAAERALAWLRACEAIWLLVLDNVASPDQLVDLLPTSGHGRVLVTSRHRGLAQFGSVVAVDVFDQQIGEEFLVSRASRPEDRDGARRLARALGGLPLALAHAGAFCAEGAAFDDYLELLEGLPAEELFESSPETYYEHTVASTWQASIAAASDQTALVRDVLGVAAWLGPDLIPSKLFATLLDDPSDLRARRALQTAIGTLHRFSLVDAAPRGVSVHRLVQKVVREDAIANARLSDPIAALAALAARFPSDTERPDAWPACEALVAHVSALARAGGDRLDPAGLAELLDRACTYLLSAGDARRAVEMAELARGLAERRLGHEHPRALGARANLGAAYRSAGRTAEAIEVEEEVLADRERLHGSDHPDTLVARARLARSYRLAGRTADAIHLLESVLADTERAAHPVMLTARADLAMAYRSAGRATDAIRLLESVVADSERLRGPDHPDTLIARGSLGASYRSAGRMVDAIAVEEAVLADSERLLGPEHPDTLVARVNLARSYRYAGRFADAIRRLEAVVADSERLRGFEHPDTLTARASLGRSYRSAGRFADAIRILESVLADGERLRGPEHPDTLTARANLARSYRSAGRTEESIRLLESVVADSGRLLGVRHPDTLVARGSLGAAYRLAGRTADAIEVEEEVFAHREQLLGREHPDTLTARANLARSYQAAGRTADAIGLLESVLADSERRRGREHPDTLTARADLAASYGFAGRRADAVRVLESVLTDSTRLLGADHPDTLAARAALKTWSQP